MWCCSVMLWSRGGGCAWLAAALGARDAAACCAALYVASLLTAPLHSWLLVSVLRLLYFGTVLKLQQQVNTGTVLIDPVFSVFRQNRKLPGVSNLWMQYVFEYLNRRIKL